MVLEKMRKRLSQRRSPESEQHPVLKEWGIRVQTSKIPLQNDIMRARYIEKLLSFEKELKEIHRKKNVLDLIDRKLKEYGVHEAKITIPKNAWEKIEGVSVRVSGDDAPILTVSRLPDGTTVTGILPKGVENVGSRKRYLGRVSAVFGRKYMIPYIVVKERAKLVESTTMPERVFPSSVSRIHGNVEIFPLEDAHQIIVRHLGNKSHEIIVEINGKDGRTHVIKLGG